MATFYRAKTGPLMLQIRVEMEIGILMLTKIQMAIIGLTLMTTETTTTNKN